MGPPKVGTKNFILDGPAFGNDWRKHLLNERDDYIFSNARITVYHRISMFNVNEQQ
jgi:hypothetical protein